LGLTCNDRPSIQKVRKVVHGDGKAIGFDGNARLWVVYALNHKRGLSGRVVDVRNAKELGGHGRVERKPVRRE
jgi:hypothetical protein